MHSLVLAAVCLGLIGQSSCSLSGMVQLHDSIEYMFFNTLSTYSVNTTMYNLVDSSSATWTGTDYILSLPLSVLHAGQLVVVNTTHNASGNVISPAATLRFAFTAKKMSDSAVLVYMEVENDGTHTAGNVELDVDLSGGLLADYGTLDYVTFPSASITIIDRRIHFTWNLGDMTTADKLNASFTAEVYKNDMANVHNLFLAELTWHEGTGSSGAKYGPMDAVFCLDKDVTYTTSVFYQHGFTALSFFMGLILGIILLILGCFLYFYLRKKKAVSPSRANEHKMMKERGKTIMMNEDEAFKKGGHTINEFSAVGEGDSIVGVLGMKDKNQMHREIDSLDIVNTVNVDTNLEMERNDASMQTTDLLVAGLQSNNDISKSTQDGVMQKMRKRRVYMDNEQDEEYKREMKKLYKKISAKNRANMNTLMQRQRKEKKELVSNTQGLPDKERNKLLDLMNEQHQSEQNAETYKLKLEQDEETEKLRKEFAIRRRMGLKEIQAQTLLDLKEDGKLSDQQMNWLLSEHQKNQKKLESMYDDEISKQRMMLEEKLARRKALTLAAETEEENNDDLLNTVAGQQLQMIEKMKKAKVISAADANEMIDEAKKNMLSIKEKMETDRTKQEEDLHKKLSALKQKRLADQAKEHELELKEYEKKSKEMQTDGPLDPMLYSEGRLKLLSQQREERSKLENDIDEEHTDQLSKLRREIETQTEEELRTISKSLDAKIPQDENTSDMVERLMQDHQNETEALRNSQQRSRERQIHKLQERLAENREQWSQRKEAEKVEQEQLREYEEQVVSKLVNSQVSMSDEERKKILEEHEKQMVKLENSLTLNKLRQKRMLEEKLAHRRAQQMEQLQMKQQMEKETQQRKLENNGEDDDEYSQQKKAELMKEHVEQKMAVLQGKKLDWDAELESIRVEMLKERSVALKEQEERLGAMVAELQMSKAKEIAKIEEQQKAIHQLKTSLIDDLNDRGVLSDPETQAVIQRHQEDQEQLNNRLDQQRVKQEQVLKRKLQMRLEQREKSLIQKQDEEIKNLMSQNKTSAKIKKMLLIHNHMVAMEKLRNQLEREISQTLEQVKHEYEICKSKAIQAQEMDFIAGLVRVGTVPKEEIESVLRVLYPHKSEAEFKEIFDKIFDPKLQRLQENMPVLPNVDSSQLKNRVQVARRASVGSLQRRMSVDSISSSRSSSLKRSKKKKPAFQSALQQQQHYEDEGFEDNSRFRPSSRQSPTDQLHPLEAGYQTGGYGQKANGHPYMYENPIMEEDEGVVTAEYMAGTYPQPPPRQLPARLPPMETGSKKKKKKKFLKKMATQGQADEDYEL